jgi:hypothetical protein
MCGPAMMLVGAGLSAASSVIGGMQTSANAKTEAQFNRRQAGLERLSGAYDIKNLDRKGQRLQGEQIAAIGASGTTMGGSNLDLLADSAKEVELDKGAIRWNTAIKAKNYEYQAKVDDQNAKQAMIGGYMGAAVPLIQAGTKLTSAYYTPFQTA